MMGNNNVNNSNLSKIKRLAFIGGGNMATALISGLSGKGLSGNQMAASDPSSEALARLSEQFGIDTSQDNARAVAKADVVVLAVKPQLLKPIAESLAPHLKADKPMVLSVVAGIPHQALTRWLGTNFPIIRTMPNRPALHGHGATGLYAPKGVTSAERLLAQSIMAAVGSTVWVEKESQLDTVTALSGSGPAYFFLLMEALEAAARERGLPADIAHQLTLDTAFGAAYMARHSREPLSTLREQVTSKGGTTAAALQVFDSKGLRAIVAAAVEAADRRSGELGDEFAAH
jgi:pyrroline-5-carboxylate reductase